MKFSDKIKKPSGPNLISFFLAILVGLLLTAQFFSTKKVEEITGPEIQENQALEVSILAESNANLRQEVNSLRVQQQEYNEALQFRLGGTEVLETTLMRYQDASGINELSGSGVTVMIDGPVLDVHLLDLLNNLRNIGVQGVALNGQRLIYKSAITPDGLQIKLDGNVITPPYRFDAVGDPDLLVTSLEREGGLLEQLIQTFPEVEVAITKKDNLTLPAYQNEITFEYAQVAAD